MLAGLCLLGMLVLRPPASAVSAAAAVAASSSTTTAVPTPMTSHASRGVRDPLPGTVTCSSVEQAGSAAALPAAALRALLPQQATSCIALLGKDPLAEDQARAIWNLLLQAYETADMVPDDTVRLLGWVSAGIPPDHITNFSLSEIDTVATLGVFHNLSIEQLTALAETVRFQWSAKDPEDMTDLDLAALNHILCGFNASDIARVHADAYKEAASSLSLLRCPGTPGAAPVPGADTGSGALPPLPALGALALLAESEDAFGDPAGWNANALRAIGCVLVGLPGSALARIPAAALHAMLQALAGSEQPVIRRCVYGTPVIAQRLSSADHPHQVTTATSSTATSTATPAGNSTVNSTSPGAVGA